MGNTITKKSKSSQNTHVDSLATPKRLFDIHHMKTVMYADVVDDVKEKGYVAISHVWGDQNIYTAEELEIKGGVTWEIPLSNQDKISRTKNFMSQYKMKYCWFDVLCMPQGEHNQWQVNLEIPFMGDYYAGASIVAVLAAVEPVVSEDFGRWYYMMNDVANKERDFTTEEREWIYSHDKVDLLDVAKDKWFTRLWTLQEAVMAKNLIFACNNGENLNLLDIAAKIGWMTRLGVPQIRMFAGSGRLIADIDIARHNRTIKHVDLMQVMRESSMRDCFKPQDKFYGTLGVLGYKNFPVSYDINLDDLGKAIVKYAYSKGDISWLAVGENIGSGFIQPMDKPFSYIGWGWREEIPGICGIRLEDDMLQINAWPFAQVVHENIMRSSKARTAGDMYGIFKSWNLDIKDIITIITGFATMSDDEFEVVEAFLERDIGNHEAIQAVIAKFGPTVTDKYIGTFGGNISKTQVGIGGKITIIKAITQENRNIPLIVYGDAGIGDQIMLIRTIDAGNRMLGIVVDEYSKRKGVCLYEKIEMTKEEISLFIPQKFLL
jgi:hypothetical protein